MKRDWFNIESWNPEMMRQFIWLLTTLFVSFWIYKLIVSIIKKQENKVKEQKITVCIITPLDYLI